MRPLPPVVVLTLALFGSGLSRAWCAGFSLFGDSWGDVITVTDMTPQGRELTRPTPDQPVYYRGSSLGCKFGSIPGDRIPDVKEMNQVVVDVLAKQGYMAANPGVHEPELFLVLQWGYLRPQSDDLFWFLGYQADKDIGAQATIGMLGPEVFRKNFRSRTIETILESASEPVYGIIVTAFEFKSASTPEPIIYWQTRIGLTARGKSMAKALPTMILAAGPTIGKETDSPVLRDADDVREGRVEMGELEILGVVDEPEATSKEAGRKK